MRSDEALITLRELVIGYPGATAILPPVSFEVHPGQVTSIVGHNGAGKSTLLRSLLRLQSSISGEVRYSARARVGFVPQRESIDPIYPLKVGPLVETGRYGLRGPGRPLRRDDHEKVLSALEITGALGLKDRLFRTLSGGEQQRVLLARALCTEPNVLVLDEPTASLDEKGANDVMDLTLKLAREQNAAIVMVNHFIDLVSKISDQVVVLDRDHRAVAVGRPDEVLVGRGRIHG